MVLSPTKIEVSASNKKNILECEVFKFLDIKLTKTVSVGNAEVQMLFSAVTSAGDTVSLDTLNKTVHLENNEPYLTSFDVTAYQRYPTLKVTFIDTVHYNNAISFHERIAEIFESTCATRWAPASLLQNNTNHMFLKAFCNFPTEDMENVYMFWEMSSDGAHWIDVDLDSQKDIEALPPKLIYMPDNTVGYSADIEDTSSLGTSYIAVKAYPVKAYSSLDNVKTRADVLEIGSFNENNLAVGKKLYRARMGVVKLAKLNVLEGTAELPVLDMELGYQEYFPIFESKAEIVFTDIVQASNSKSLRYSSTLYGFGNSKFKNYIVPTYAGESVRPLGKLITLNTYENTIVTALIPWRDYLVAFTENSTHLITMSEDSSYTKTVNSDTGVPVSDWRCCKSILNGVIFKSGSRVYFMYPNTYSGTDTIANLTDISEPISDYLIEYPENVTNTPFAITSDDYYMLFMPKESSTVCLKYEYLDKRWTVHEYPVVFFNYETFSHGDTRLFGYVVVENKRVYGEYSINLDIEDMFTDIAENLPYGDFIVESSSGIAADIANWGTVAYEGKLTPIHFILDSGQKTDSKWYAKQFTESKFVLSTQSQKDAFPMQVTVHIDGTPHVHVMDVNTDSSFWKTSVDDIGTVSTEFYTANSNTFNTYRKMFIRYSGKGTSIRHIIEGDSLYPFKLYDVIYRFKVLNIKK